MIMDTEEAKKNLQNEENETLRDIFREVYEEDEDRPFCLQSYGRYCPEANNPNTMLGLQNVGRRKEKFFKVAGGKDKVPWEEYREILGEERTVADALQLTPEDMEEDREFNFLDLLLAEHYGRAEEYLAHKEPHVQEAFIPYIEEAILLMDTLGIGEPLYYYRYKYGWNDKAFQERFIEGKGYGYVAKEELSEQDRKALYYAALQIYYMAEDILGEARNRFAIDGFGRKRTGKKAYESRIVRRIEKMKEEEGDTHVPIEIERDWSIYYPYPFNGRPKEDIEDSFIANRPEDFKYGDNIVDFNRWACTEYYLPYMLHRLDYAIYLAFRYEGEEYREYLSTLDFKSDFDKFYEGETKNGEPISYERLTARNEPKKQK